MIHNVRRFTNTSHTLFTHYTKFLPHPFYSYPIYISPFSSTLLSSLPHICDCIILNDHAHIISIVPAHFLVAPEHSHNDKKTHFTFISNPPNTNTEAACWTSVRWRWRCTIRAIGRWAFASIPAISPICRCCRVTPSRRWPTALRCRGSPSWRSSRPTTSTRRRSSAWTSRATASIASALARIWVSVCVNVVFSRRPCIYATKSYKITLKKKKTLIKNVSCKVAKCRFGIIAILFK